MVFQDGNYEGASGYWERQAEKKGTKPSGQDSKTEITGEGVKRSATNTNLGSKLAGQFMTLMFSGQELDRDTKTWLHQYNQDYMTWASTEGDDITTRQGTFEPGSRFGLKGTMAGKFNQGSSDQKFMDVMAEPLTHAMNAAPLALLSKFSLGGKIGTIGALLGIQMGSTDEGTAQSPLASAFIDPQTGKKNALGKFVAPIESPLGTLALWGILPNLAGKAVGRFRHVDNLNFRMKIAKLADIPVSMMKNIPSNLQKSGAKMMTMMKEGFTESMVKEISKGSGGRALVKVDKRNIEVGRGKGFLRTKTMTPFEEMVGKEFGEGPSRAAMDRQRTADERLRRKAEKHFKKKFMKSAGGKSYVEHGGKQISWKDVYNKTEKGKQYLDDLAKTRNIRGVSQKLTGMKSNAAKWIKDAAKNLRNIKPGMVAKGANVPALYAQIMAEQIYMNNLGFDTGSDMEAQDAWNYALGIGGDTGAAGALERRSEALGDEGRIELAEQVKKLIDSEG